MAQMHYDNMTMDTTAAAMCNTIELCQLLQQCKSKLNTCRPEYMQAYYRTPRGLTLIFSKVCLRNMAAICFYEKVTAK